MNCKHCKYWNRRTIYVVEYLNKDNSISRCFKDNPKVYDNEKLVQTHDSQFGICNCSKIKNASREVFISSSPIDLIFKNENSSLLYYCDDVIEGIDLFTGESFGCIHFKNLCSTKQH